MIVTLHPARSARSFFVNTRDEFVPCAEVMPFIAVSGVSMTGITQPETDCVAEKVSAFVDDHLSVNVDAAAATEVALLTVRVAVGRGMAGPADNEAAVDVPIRYDGTCAAVEDAAGAGMEGAGVVLAVFTVGSVGDVTGAVAGGANAPK